MRGFRSKFILLLIVYFAGFATAIYTLAPAPDNDTLSTETQTSWSFSALKSNEFAQSCNVSLHRCVDFFKDISCQAGKFIKEKINERKAES
ncbi:MAG: hypothetical protein JW804_09175 [Sedimentisphaerales bacterium]|nr:hypothetical protein [Sedimentisphaerales bacterium]